MTYRPHQLSQLFPPMDKSAFGDLVADIGANGQSFPIILYEGKILDGVHRQNACLKADVEPQYIEFEGDDPLAFVVSVNLKRRHLTESQRAMIAKKLAKLSKKKKIKNAPKGAKKDKKHQTLSETKAAKLLKVSRRSLTRAGEVIDKGTEELQAAVEADEIGVTPAAEIAKLPKKEQANAVKQHLARRAVRVKNKPKTGFILELNAAWNHADDTQRTRFLDGIGVDVIWQAMPEHQKERLRTIIGMVAIASTPLPFEDKMKLIEADKTGRTLSADDLSVREDLSIPNFLKRS